MTADELKAKQQELAENGKHFYYDAESGAHVCAPTPQAEPEPVSKKKK